MERVHYGPSFREADTDHGPLWPSRTEAAVPEARDFRLALEGGFKRNRYPDRSRGEVLLGLCRTARQAIDAVVRSANRTLLLVSGGERAGYEAMPAQWPQDVSQGKWLGDGAGGLAGEYPFRVEGPVQEG
jgi:hypothetical protein